MNLVARKITVKGRVQGVGFRQFTVSAAERFNIKGTVRNLPNGNVESIAVGSLENIKKFIELLKKGPSLSRVDSLEIEELTEIPNFKDFRIVY